MPISTRFMPIIFTANEIERISEPLLDRCMVFEYPEASVEQLFSICKDYCAQLLKQNNYAERVILDASTLFDGIKLLYTYNHSIRQHKCIVENVLGRANIVSLENKGKPVKVPLKAFEQVVFKDNGKSGRRIGFG